jgi:hypothetical protein
MFSASISATPGESILIIVTEAEDQYISDVVQVLTVAAELRRCEIDALAQHRLFGETGEDR